MKSLRIATRESPLALWQAEFVRDQLQRHHESLEIELVGMTTQGDQWLSSPLSEVGGKGLFIKELEQAMRLGRADIAVHSVKDLPAELPEGFILPVIGFRADQHDVLVSAKGDLEYLPEGARVGSSSLRRQAQLLHHRPDLKMSSVRGNVGTRLAKLDQGEFDAIVLAAAGLQRLGLARQDVYPISTELCLPAPGQGALGIECVADSAALQLLQPLVDTQTERCVRAERGVSAGLGADCALPVAAMASAIDTDVIVLSALVADASGTKILQAQASGQQPEDVAKEVVEQLFSAGAQQVLDDIRDRR
ncbi:MAG: hydroxymethylbilane synthase [Pseudomonadota bacterium]|nr:hydroxymethylbilane synthase [Pseudomonadota bacterium]